MELIETPLLDAKIIVPRVFEDERGYFYESFNEKSFNEKIGDYNFVQDNQSKSQKGVLRGLHFQNPPYEQGKLVRVLAGSVLDVIVDIRKNSPTYGKHFSYVLCAAKKHAMWVPPGFAHGFLTLEDETVFFYKVTNYYNKESEGCIAYNSKDLGINWGIENPILSEKDKNASAFATFTSQF
ncbi:MAG: dTDP-4-dehydrorhamnose 3,5-epimerase [Bacteroidota bacterium]|jgi:dTDP-4-dehydrorhamnose 3,5-epimerase